MWTVFLYTGPSKSLDQALGPGLASCAPFPSTRVLTSRLLSVPPPPHAGAGKSLEQVRATALSTLAALNQTAAVLDRVIAAVEAAKKSKKHHDQEEIKRVAVAVSRSRSCDAGSHPLALPFRQEAP